MAKKKNQSKKHKFKYAAATTPNAPAENAGAVQGPSSIQTEKPNATSVKPALKKRPDIRRGSGSGVVVSRDFSYVSHDLRRIAILAVSLIALEAVLWFVFGHTGVGTSIYRMVQV